MAQPDDLTELDHPEGRRRLTSFEIEGSGTWKKRDKDSVDFESEFRVVEGTGRKEFEGITGRGNLWVDMGAARMCSKGTGFCFFEDMNHIGAMLMK